MRRVPWWALALLAIAVIGGGGYYVTQTDRKRGPRWDRLLPQMRAKVLELEQRANAAGLPVMFFEGWRTPEASAANMAAGTSKVKDPLDSLHVWGAAADLVFRNAAGLPYWPPATDPRWRQLAKLGESIGLRSGGLMWGWDWPHFQLPGVTAGALRARYQTNFLAYLRDNGALVA